MTEFGIEEAILDDVRQVLAEYSNAEKAVIFGSRATGEFSNASDIDIAVFAPFMDEEVFAQLWFDLDNLPIVFKMDIIHFDTLANETMKEKILQEGKIFYNRG